VAAIWAISSDAGLDKEIHGPYIARKQTHIHKIAMVLSAAQRNDRIIQADDLETAKELLTSLEPGFSRVFSAISDNREVHYFTMLVRLVSAHPQGIKKKEAWKRLAAVMTFDQFEVALNGAIRADYFFEYAGSGDPMLRPHTAPKPVDKAVETPFRLAAPAREVSLDEYAALTNPLSDQGTSAILAKEHHG